MPVEKYVETVEKDPLNVSGPCDLSVHSITPAQKCQAPPHQKSHTYTQKNISTPNKYPQTD